MIKDDGKILSDFSKEDFDHFLHHLLNPPSPNQKLIEAFKRYEERKNDYTT